MNSSRPVSHRDLSWALRERQREMEREDRFSEAQELDREMERMKVREEVQWEEMERERQDGERNTVETGHLQQFIMLKEEWDSNFQLFDSETQRLEQDLLFRQSEERKDLEDSLSRPSRVKLTPRLLNLKERKQQAIKQKRYMDAQTLTVEIQTLFQEFSLKVRSNLDVKSQNKLAVLSEKHSKELNAFRQKRLIAREEMKKDRESALDWLCKKYEKNRKELEGLHRHQRVQSRATTMVFTAPVSIARVIAVSKSCLVSPRGTEKSVSRLA